MAPTQIPVLPLGLTLYDAFGKFFRRPEETPPPPNQPQDPKNEEQTTMLGFLGANNWTDAEEAMQILQAHDGKAAATLYLDIKNKDMNLAMDLVKNFHAQTLGRLAASLPEAFRDRHTERLTALVRDLKTLQAALLTTEPTKTLRQELLALLERISKALEYRQAKIEELLGSPDLEKFDAIDPTKRWLEETHRPELKKMHEKIRALAALLQKSSENLSDVHEQLTGEASDITPFLSETERQIRLFRYPSTIN